MKKELKSGVLSADKSADCRPTVGGVNGIAVLVDSMCSSSKENRDYTTNSLSIALRQSVTVTSLVSLSRATK